MDKIKIGESIYNLRKSKKITQEQLGEYIGVSKGAISKWESGVSYPDIEMLPVLARFFNISIDELLNYDAELSEERENEIYEEVKKIINEENIDESLELCKEYINKYNRNYKLKFKLATLMTMSCALIRDEEKIKNIYGKAISIYEDIVNNSTDDEILEASRLQLSMYYASFEDYDKALDVLDKLKRPIGNTNIMKASMYIRKNEVQEGRKLYQWEFLHSITEAQAILHGLAASYYKEDLNKAEQYMDISYNINQLAKHNKFNNVFNHFIQLAGFYAYYKDENRCLESIEKAIEGLEISVEDIENPWYFNELKINGEYSTMIKMSKAVVNLLDMDEYSFLKEDSKFIELKKRAGKIKL